MLLMSLVPPLDTGITWSAANFLRLPQAKQWFPFCLHRAFHWAPLKEPPALVFLVRRFSTHALFLSGFLCDHLAFAAFTFSGFFLAHEIFVRVLLFLFF